MQGSEWRASGGPEVRGRWAALGIIASMWALSGVPGEARPIEPENAQFVFVLDDSGSMGESGYWGPAADGDRLAVLAVRSLVSTLDDDEWVSVVPLNQGGDPLRLRPLSENRRRVEEMLDLSASLPRYEGKATPCQRALAQVKTLLQDAYSPRRPQVVFFLTDGQCNGGKVDVEGFLRDLRSHRDGRFQFYFLTFKGRDTTDALRQLADRTGGETIPVEGGRPADVLHAFATALSRSQGYEGRLLDEVDSKLDPYRGAERIRLLAMVKEEADRPLGDLTLKATSGGRSVPVEVLDSPEPHQYEDGGVYHYVAGTYDPTGAEVEVDLEGTDRWKMVALPEYRLT
ncbi:MAG: vWA domain-containing protein, partial [Acidobacteriota bacterium]